MTYRITLYLVGYSNKANEESQNTAKYWHRIVNQPDMIFNHTYAWFAFAVMVKKLDLNKQSHQYLYKSTVNLARSARPVF